MHPKLQLNRSQLVGVAHPRHCRGHLRRARRGCGPDITWVTIAIFFGAYAFVDGVFAILATIRAAETHERWWPFLIEGIVGILIAAIAFYDINIVIAALYLTIAAWAFLTGIFELVAAVQLRKQIANEILVNPRWSCLHRVRRVDAALPDYLSRS